MKKKFLFVFVLITGIIYSSRAQVNLGNVLASGIEDTRTFATHYLQPGVEGMIWNRTSGWYQTAKVKGIGGFELSVIGNAAWTPEQSRTFLFDPSEYENVRLAGGKPGREVPSILGVESSPVGVLITPEGTSEEYLFQLPQGISPSGIDAIPAIFLQGRLGIFKGTELKARYFPRTENGGVSVEVYGGAIQHEFTSWLEAPDLFPVSIAGMITYSAMQGSYDFSELEWIPGENQQLESKMDLWLFSAIASTNFSVLNFYGGVGYLEGSGDTRMLGTYTIMDQATGESIRSVTDPLSVSHNVDGIKATAGLSLKLGPVKLHADYNFQEFETISAGLHFGI